MAVLVLGVVGAVRLLRPYRDGAGRPEVGHGTDPAQRELRQRYAVGDIDREEFLQRKIDLEP